MALIELRNISYQRSGITVLKNVSLSLPQAGMIYLTGPNGGGKSTLLKLIAGILKPTSGQISRPPPSLFSLMSSLSEYNTELPLSVSSVLKLFQVDISNDLEALALAQKWGIQDILHRQISRLSSGELQKVILLAHLSRRNKDIFLLDEPLSHIAPESSLHLWESIFELSQTKLVVMITHHTHLIQKFKGPDFCVHQILHKNMEER